MLPRMPSAAASEIRKELARARAADQVHGAYLLAGPPGTGKRETALWLARLLLCRADGPDPCEACGGCQRTRGPDPHEWSHPDLRLLEPEKSALTIDQVRDLQRELSLVANEGGRRVAVLFAVERLQARPANALLKTLEEPPAGATLVLLATSADALPATLRSRSVVYQFRPEAEATIEAALREAGLDESDAWLAAALGGGSTLAARGWADEHLEAARELRTALEAAAAGSASQALDLAESFRGAGEIVRSRCELFLAVHGALARRRIAEAAQADDRAALECWLERAESGARARREIAIRNLNPQLVVEGLMLDLRS